MKVNITFETGNDAVQTKGDVVMILHELIQHYLQRPGSFEIELDSWIIRDVNGNNIGKIKIS